MRSISICDITALHNIVQGFVVLNQKIGVEEKESYAGNFESMTVLVFYNNATELIPYFNMNIKRFFIII